MSASEVNVRDVIYDQIETVARAEQEDSRAAYRQESCCWSPVSNSLCVAILVANLEDELGVDPFGSGDDVQMPVTVGDFVRVYENAMQ